MATACRRVITGPQWFYRPLRRCVAGDERRAPMLRPQDTASRERKTLNGLWDFRLDATGAGRREGWHRAPLAGAQAMPVPASYNDVLVGTTGRDHVGDAWYQTTVRVPRGWAGQRVVLRFDSATHAAVVWVGDTEVARHEGGYTPFEADVTDARLPRRRGPRDRGREQRADLPDHPAGHRARHPAGASAAVLPRLLQLRRPAPVGLAVRDADDLRRRHRGGHATCRARRASSRTTSRSRAGRSTTCA